MEFAPIVDALKDFIPESLIHLLIVIAFCIFIIGWVIPKIISVFKIGYGFGKKINRLFSLADEFKNNGGSSLRDAIDRIESNTNLVSGRLNGLFYVFGQNLGVVTIESDINGKVVHICKRWTELTGLNVDESLGHGWLNGILDKDRLTVGMDFAAAVKETREFHSEFSIHNRTTNKITKVKSYSIVIRDNNKGAVRYLIIITPNNPVTKGDYNAEFKS